MDNKFCYPFYLGFTGGGGSTTWGTLVPPKNRQIDALSLSTPIHVNEGGSIWGFFAGYELIPFFAVEAAYTHYPKATVAFDAEKSLFAFDHDGVTEFVTRTEAVSLVGKFMFLIPHTTVRAFSSVGPAVVHRKDVIVNHWRVSASFNVGLNYNFNEHIMGEIGFNYTSGFGVSEIDPAEDFMPFLYSGFFRLAYRF